MVIVMVMFGKPKSTEDRKKGKEKLQLSQNLGVPSITESSGYEQSSGNVTYEQHE